MPRTKISKPLNDDCTDEADRPIGYANPPRSTRWRKGQCGNPGRIKQKNISSPFEVVEKALIREVKLVQEGKIAKVSTVKAILLRLWSKAMKGDTRALSVFLKYFRCVEPRIPPPEAVFEFEYQPFLKMEDLHDL